jgi:hypothetical protein
MFQTFKKSVVKGENGFALFFRKNFRRPSDLKGRLKI